MNFDYADVTLRDMNRRNVRSFGKLSTLKFDELNVLTGNVKAVYDESAKLAKRRYKQIAIEAFMAALLELSYEAERAEAETQDFITNDWVLDMLEDYDPVTKYQFTAEVDRKRQRLTEALMAVDGKVKRDFEVKRALRLWTLQITHYAERSVVDGTIDGYKAAGVKRVMWVAVDDEKTCSECMALDGKIFNIDTVPDRLHYRCRCQLKAVK